MKVAGLPTETDSGPGLPTPLHSMFRSLILDINPELLSADSGIVFLVQIEGMLMERTGLLRQVGQVIARSETPEFLYQLGRCRTCCALNSRQLPQGSPNQSR